MSTVFTLLLPVGQERLGFASRALYPKYASEVNEFLAQMNDLASKRVLVVGATNCLEKIDLAALRPGRFDKKILVGLPDLEARVELLRLYCSGRPQEAIDLLRLAMESQGYTCAEIENVVNESARRALESRRPICESDMMSVLSSNPPAHASADVESDSSAD